MGQKVTLEIQRNKKVDLAIQRNGNINLDISKASGTTNYNALTNKPILNGITIEGSKVSADYKIQDMMNDITEQEIDTIVYG